MDDIDIVNEANEVFVSMKLKSVSLAVGTGLPVPETPRPCEDCGEIIPLKRVQAIPATRRCISCQELFERGID